MRSADSLVLQFSETDAQKLAESLYGIRTSAKRLDGEVDQNFLFDTGEGQRFVLKISSGSEMLEILKMQNEAMHVLANSAEKIPCSRVMKSLAGREIETVQKSEARIFNVRLLTFLDGTFMVDQKDHSPALLQNLGRFLGRLDNTLTDFHHPAAARQLIWDIKTADRISPLTRHIPEAGKRRIADYFFQQFETFVRPRVPELRCSVIHNDANDHNILVDADDIAGIIDFGDMIYTCTVNELAIVLAYAILGKEDPLTTASHVVAGYHEINPLLPEEIELLFYLMCIRLCVSVALSAKRKKQQPDNQYLSVSEADAWTALDHLISINPINAQNRFAEACGLAKATVHKPGFSSEEIIGLRNRHLGKSLSVSYRKPLKIVQGALQYLFAGDGRTYLDCVNNVSHVGHCHPDVVKAIQSQAAILNTNTRYLHGHLATYARRLASKLPDPLNVCFFVNSGSEANDLALRLARNYTGHHDVVVVDHAYHGNLTPLIEISPYKHDGRGGQGAPSYVHKVPMPDVYRGIYSSSSTETGLKYAREIENKIEQAQRQGQKIAAMICESLPGCGGQIVFPPGYLRDAFKYVRVAGGVCIADEVQVGFGRVGKHFWGFETQSVVPDIVTLGKPIGNGHPVGAVVTTHEIADAFANGMEYFNTFGGNPVSCAAGLAVLDVIEHENLQQNAWEVGNHLKDGLHEVERQHGLIGDVRGLGLFIGIELVSDRKELTPAAREAKVMVERMKEEGILLSIDGPLCNVIKIKPPMVFSRANVDRLVNTLDKVLRHF